MENVDKSARKKIKFGDLTFQEIRERARSGCLAILPTGCTEQQGPHLPVDFDTWLAETVCLAAAGYAAQKYSLDVLVLPAIPYGPTPEHRNYGNGYIDIPQDLHEGFVGAVLNSLADQGFRRMIVWRGCGQHDLGRVVESFNQDRYGKAIAFLPELPYAEIMANAAPHIAGGHADSFATSLALYLRPESVRTQLIPAPVKIPVDWGDPELDFSRYSSNGVIGDATQASRKLGEKLWGLIVGEVASVFREIAAN
jgi:creatinine amidohydrolase